MEKEAAIAIWAALEKLEYRVEADPDIADDQPFDTPVFNVRLDATSEGVERSYRVRVTGTGADLDPEWWRQVIEAAQEAGVDLDIQNNGIELS